MSTGNQAQQALMKGLVNAVANMSVRKRKRKAKQKQVVVVAPTSATGKRRRRRRNRKSSAGPVTVVSNIAEFSLRRMEFVTSVTPVAGSFSLSPNDFAFIKAFAPKFEMFRFLSCRIWYKPMVGTTEGGAITIGVDWNGMNVAKTRSSISGYTPNLNTSVWQEASFDLPSSMLQSRPWFMMATNASEYNNTTRAGVVAYKLDASDDKKTYGDIWVEYHIQMKGTTS